jgi:hypothetical protein
MVRDMSGLIDSLSNSLLDRINNLTSALSSSIGNISTGSSQLEQNVKIEASFPNVSSSSEIEKAFNNLVNSASQYAYRK